MSVKAIFLAVAAVATVGAAKNWTQTITRGTDSHMIGRAEAPVTVSEFVSYTCPHCAQFAGAGEQALKLGYVAPGKVQLEVRHALHNPVDLAATLAAWCGPATKFPGNHAALLSTQGQWLPKLQASTTGQRQRWVSGPMADRMKAIASDAGFYDILSPRGYTRNDLDRCLADDALAKRLATGAQADEARGVRATPSFAIDGTVLSDIHEWRTLEPRLAAAVPKPR